MIKLLALAVSLLTAQANPLVGTWTLARADVLLPNGTRTEDYGPNPHGLVIFTADGHYSLQIYRAVRTKFASGDKTKGTPEEYRDASLGMSVSFGRYEVDAATQTLTLHVDRGSFPNNDDTSPVRHYEINGDEISWKVKARPDGSIPITVIRRIP